MPPAARPQVRDALLAAARTELAEHGRAAISLRAVARRAGLSHAVTVPQHPVNACAEGWGMVHLALLLLKFRGLPAPLVVLVILVLIGYGFYYFFLRERPVR